MAWSFLSFPEFCGAVNLSDVVQIILNVSNQSGGSGDIVAKFDDLAVALLEDGFEIGDTTRWSAALP